MRAVQILKVSLKIASENFIASHPFLNKQKYRLLLLKYLYIPTIDENLLERLMFLSVVIKAFDSSVIMIKFCKSRMQGTGFVNYSKLRQILVSVHDEFNDGENASCINEPQ